MTGSRRSESRRPTRSTRSTRRRALAAVASSGLAALAGCGSLPARVSVETERNSFEVFALDAHASGWHGVRPRAIRDERNPLLRTRPGTTVRLAWTNADGKPHRFVVEDSNGNRLFQTRRTTEEGERVTASFEATQEMTTYRDPNNPVTMHGEVLVTDV